MTDREQLNTYLAATEQRLDEDKSQEFPCVNRVVTHEICRMTRELLTHIDAQAARIEEQQRNLDHREFLLQSSIDTTGQQIRSLVMMVKRLGYSLKHEKPNSKLPGEAMEFLTKHGLVSVEDILR